MKKKTVALLMALVLIFGVAAGGTVAWLTDKTETITNTFIDSDINIKLEETTPATYKMVPGGKITKDPKVTVEKGSEACWLFVKLEKSDTYQNYLADYELDSAAGWQQVSGVNNVYYIQVSEADAKNGREYQVLANNQLTVLGSVTKAMMDSIDGLKEDGTAYGDETQAKAETDKRPTLKVTAYAIQSANLAFTDAATTDGLKAAEAYTMATTNP